VVRFHAPAEAKGQVGMSDSGVGKWSMTLSLMHSDVVQDTACIEYCTGAKR
jgi:hypothetical protein